MPSTTAMGHAVVIGASMTGLIAARVLSDAYQRVTIIDRDTLPTSAQPRRGTPQSRHIHILLARGRQALDELFPGFTQEMTALGASTGDSQRDIHFYNDGQALYPSPSGLIALGASRPLIEHVIRTRVMALPQTHFMDTCEALGLVTTADGKQVTGVKVFHENSKSVIDADLVIDASGRGSRSLTWLAELGYRMPVEEKVAVNMTYVTRHYQRQPHLLGGDLGLGNGAYPGQLRGGYVLAQENNQFTLTLTGMLTEESPTDGTGMAAYADTLTSSHIAEVIREAIPIDEAVKMRYPASTRRRYERLRRFPDGYLVMGDALCSFNPVYGQGMTVAALEGLLLQRLLDTQTKNLASVFFKQAAKLLDNPWAIATGNDLRFPQVQGKRTLMVRFLHAYLTRFHIAAASDAQLGTAFLRVANLIDPPSRLLAPWVIRRVLFTPDRGQKHRPRATPTPQARQRPV